MAIYIIWGSTYLAIKYAVATMPPFAMAATRFLIAGGILYVWARLRNNVETRRVHWLHAMGLGVLLLCGGNGAVVWAQQFVPSGIAALMITTSPFWLVLFESLRAGGTKPSWQAILGLVIGFIGVFILVGPAEITGTGGSFDTFGIILLLLAPLFWSMGSIYAKGADMPKSTLLSTGMQMLMGAAALFLVSVVRGELNGFSLGAVSLRSWLALLYLITFGSLIGFVSYGWLLHNAPISLMSTYAYVNPVVAVLLGSLFADEPLNGRILIAAAIIIGSVVLINSARQSKLKVKTESLQAVSDGDD